MKKDPFQFVLRHSLELKVLDSILNLLSWDQETVMPPRAVEHRCHQKTLLAGIIHQKKIDDDFFDALKKAAHSFKNKDSDKAILLKRMLSDITKARKLPQSFVERYTTATSHSFSAWERAKAENDWSIFEPHFEKVLDLLREKSSLLGFTEHPLDPLLDEYEPGLKTSNVSLLFSSLQPRLSQILEKVKETPFFGANAPLFPTSLENQLQLSREILTTIGYDWERGRLDTSAHPFSFSTHPTDARITIRHNHNNTLDQLLSAIHEGGHGLYDMGLDREQYGNPLGEAVSLSIHESQSRFWETIIGQSRMFCPFLLKALKKYCPVPEEEAFYRGLNGVHCSLIRVEADEVTYPFHVLLRFEIEKELLDGSLAVKDVPERWNAGMKATLGIEPTSAKEGCLQDVHWSMGTIGYFPTYVLGSMYAASLWAAIQRDLPDIKNLIRSGIFAPIHTWLHDRIWRHGRRFLSQELIEKATGAHPTMEDYLSYLEEKYINHE